jgi:hypothetical protein
MTPRNAVTEGARLLIGCRSVDDRRVAPPGEVEAVFGARAGGAGPPAGQPTWRARGGSAGRGQAAVPSRPTSCSSHELPSGSSNAANEP